MVYFDSDKNDVINQMWINVRCFNLYDVPVWAWAIAAAVAAVLIYLFVRMKQRQKMYE
jgi:spermidine/putrescine transport system substrate-binding protein